MRALPLSLFVAVAVAACAGPIASPAASSPAPIAPTPSASSGVADATPSAAPSANPTRTPKPTAKPVGMCLASDLSARITGWEAGQGHRTALVTVTNTSSAPCIVQGTPRLQLLDHARTVLMDSRTDGATGLPHVAPGDRKFRLAKGGTVDTMVDTDSYCGPAPAFPLTVAFILPSGPKRLVAAPGPGSDIPPCMRTAGSPGTIAMNGWVR